MNRLLRLLAVSSSLMLRAWAAGPPGGGEEEAPAYFRGCSAGIYEVVKFEVKNNPSVVNAVTDEGEHCLHLCAADGLEGNVRVARMILEAGADPNVREGNLRTHPLSWAVYHGNHAMASLLLEHGADVNADFDSRRKLEDGTPAKLNVLDVVEGILAGLEEEERVEEEEEKAKADGGEEEEKKKDKKEIAKEKKERKERKKKRKKQKKKFAKTRNVLVKAGAARYDGSEGVSRYVPVQKPETEQETEQEEVQELWKAFKATIEGVATVGNYCDKGITFSSELVG